eukprot:s1878_g7.t1
MAPGPGVSRAKLSTAEEAAKEHALKDRLVKELANLKLEADPSSLKKEASLTKDAASSAAGAASCSAAGAASPCDAAGTTPLKKGKKTLKKVVVVDWHNTLEKGNKVSEANLRALETLMLLAEVHIISWVGSQGRYDPTLKQIQRRRGRWAGPAGLGLLRPSLMTMQINSHSGKTFWSFADAVDQWVLDQKRKP